MAPGRGALAGATDADEVQPGAKVCINGLKNATQLNGQRGIILSKQDERWAVKLDASGERVLVRGANLKVRVEYQPVLQGCGTEKANSDGAGTSRDGADPTSKLPAGSERLPRFNAHKPLVPQIIGLRKQVLEFARQGSLSANDMADYHIFLVASETFLEKRKVQIAQQWQLTQAHARAGGRNQAAHEEKLERLRTAEARFNQEAHMHGKEKDWLRALPAYQQACHLVRDSGEFKFDASGTPYNVKEQQKDEEEIFGLSFEEVLAQEKGAAFDLRGSGGMAASHR